MHRVKWSAPFAPKLRLLHLADNHIKSMEGVSVLQKLEDLNLAKNKMGDLRTLMENRALTKLNVVSMLFPTCNFSNLGRSGKIVFLRYKQLLNYKRSFTAHENRSPLTRSVIFGKW